MLPEKPGYGSIASAVPTDEEEAQLHDSVVHHGEAQAKRTSGVFMAMFAIALFGAFISRGFVAVADQADLTMTSTILTSHHHAKIMLDKHYDEVEIYYDKQAVDHMDAKNKKVFPHRFYKISKHWKGPGHPILVIMGGEDSLDLPMLYPYVYEGLANDLHAYVLSPEHRFYGKSQPVHQATNEELIKYLTPDQALLDAIDLIQFTRKSIGCSFDRTSKHYCPVITVGGSYPGFLSAMLRFRFPDIVDISYAASAPLELYSQEAPADAYFDKVSEVAEIASSGCVNAVRGTMYSAREELLTDFTSVKEAASETGFCSDTFPTYMENIEHFISDAITYLIPAVFADFNMAYYPPGPTRALERACHIFKDDSFPPLKRISKFYDLRGEVEYGLEKKPKCFDLSMELPSGPNATIRSSDTSGCGGGDTGEIWEFQSCKDLCQKASYSESSMFITKEYDFPWIKAHCESRFEGIPVEPTRLVNSWHFDDLSHASRILFTNGLMDGWSSSSILESDNPNIAILNFPNGAHHSDLTQRYPDPNDTEDIIQGHKQVKEILRQWLDDIKVEGQP